MATYHCSVKTISRSSGRSSVAAAAYRSGDILTNARDGITHDYSRKQGIQHSEILLPENAPEQYKNRSILWNAVEAAERGKNARTVREIEIALPAELSTREQAELVRDYAQRNFVNRGMCVDFSIHDTGSGNPHAHIMLTVRSIDKSGKWESKQRKEYILDKDGQKQYDPKRKTYKCRAVKTTDWDAPERVTEWREDWAKSYNREMEKKNLPERVDHRSLAAQGIEREPTIHMGKAAQMEERGIRTERGDINRERESSGRELAAIEEELRALAAEREQTAAEPRRTEQPPGPEQVADYINQKREKCMELSDKIAAEANREKAINAEYQRQRGQLQKMVNEYKDIEKLLQKARELKAKKAEIQSKGFFHDKKAVKAIESQLASLEQSFNQGLAVYRAHWESEPKQQQVEEKVMQGRKRLDELQALADKPPEQSTKQLHAEMDKTVLEYKTAKVLADMRPDRELIREMIKSRRAYTKNPNPGDRDPMQDFYLRSERLDRKLARNKELSKLDQLTQGDFQAVAERLKKDNPDIAEMVLQHAQRVQEQRKEIDRGISRGMER